MCASHSNDSSLKKSHRGDFYKHIMLFPTLTKRKKLHNFVCNYVLYSKYFLSDISHLFITTDEQTVTKCCAT